MRLRLPDPRRSGLGLWLWLPLALSCRKAPLFDVNAGFVLADASWFEDEETLFAFYEVTAEQGIGDPSVVEITYRTDDTFVDWTPVTDLEMVHTHLPVDCGVDSLCGSLSLHVPLEPRQVRLRLRYHREGDLALQPRTVFNAVESGLPHDSRSLAVYGVFDETNTRIQWRARHQFPTLRNEQAEAYGLRRTFVVRDQVYGREALAGGDNPYGYGAVCPEDFVDAGLEEVATGDRAVFHPDPLPLGASDASLVCAQATVTDARGLFTTGAVARKNPEVRPAFPVLRSPVRDATPLKFFLGPCERTISAEHEEMLRQRLQLENVPTTCTDDWERPGFVEELVVLFRDAVEAERRTGNDMVLVVGINQDDDGVSDAVEEALAAVAPAERHRNTPRLTGAFVLDSTIKGLELEELAPVTLWCPSTFESPGASSRDCAIAPENPDLVLGPFSFATLPILPSRDQYLDFIDTYSVRQAGSVQSLSFRAPEFPTTSEHVDLGPFGVITFLNAETISADPRDAFSYCVPETPELVVFRSELLRELSFYDCAYAGFPEDFCESGVLSLDVLPDWHQSFGERSYQLGVAWDFPFLLQMEYELAQAGSVTAFGFSVPFGIADPETSYYGTDTWARDEFSLEDVLTQCDRFCDHPTFDSAGAYQVAAPFRTTYANNCYLPDYPEPGDSGFPFDP